MDSEELYDKLLQEHDFVKQYEPLGDLHKINSRVAMRHALGKSSENSKNREHYIERGEDYWVLNIVSDENWEDSDIQWGMEYGFVFHRDKTSAFYLSTHRNTEDPERYSQSIVSDILPTLIERSIDEYLE